MTSKSTAHEEYELSPSASHELDDSDVFSYAGDEHASHLLSGQNIARHKVRRRLPRFFSTNFIPLPLRRAFFSQRPRSPRFSRGCGCSRRSFLRRFTLLSYTVFILVLILTFIGATFFPSYTHPPPHYTQLRQRATVSNTPGRGNLARQKVFIAAAISDSDGSLASGPWANNILQLIDLLGPENTFLSIYENDSGPKGQRALLELKERVPCRHSLIYEEHLPWQELPHVIIPDGSKRVKRIEYLAEVRNRAFLPLDTDQTLYDKLIYLNDVFFDPVDILQLLFSTNADEKGHADYRAACAVDFLNPFKFYDTFATRDIGGNSMGVPFFPWFGYYGDKRSHQDVLQGKDAVRVRSCWGGISVFDMRFFQKQPDSVLIPETAGAKSPSKLSAPYRFRAETDLYWDASECCLIQADIQSPDPENTGIYMNPFVRVAYDPYTLSWLQFTRRFERLYTPIHYLIDVLASMPRYNPRRDEEPWQKVDEMVWVPDQNLETGGSFQSVSRLASHSGFCGRRKLPVMKENWTPGSGGRYYEMLPVPS